MSTVADDRQPLSAIPFRLLSPRGSLPYVEADVRAGYSAQILTVTFYQGRPEFTAVISLMEQYRAVEKRMMEAEKGLGAAHEELDRLKRVLEQKDQQISGYANQIK